ncbi:MAG TPA: pyridoxamine 5'-phosphate oxidase family protein [Pseudonocardiaceae bacterium]|nr:pyridoxamine 5'-phosphate oxidase family protein [Pseudonocardiaceae bacterium]
MFHSGELDVQRRAGVSGEAARLAGMLDPAQLGGGAAKFLSQRRFAALTGRDRRGALWTSPLFGAAGFLDGLGTTLDVHAVPTESDPLHALPVGQEVGLLAVEFAIRRRMRINGLLSEVGPDRLTIDVEQAYGNCPSYIQQRVLEPTASRPTTSVATETESLNPGQRAIIEAADTFFLGTAHPTRGADASHKGGTPGFVRIDGADLWWPDYAGNNLFNSMGNIAVNPEAALLFVDFTTGLTLHLSGRAELEWITPGSAGDDGNTGRRVRFHPDRIVSAPRLPLRAIGVNLSPYNPTLAA